MVELRITKGVKFPLLFKTYDMAEIKNIFLLTDLSDQDKAMMEHAGIEHRRHGNIMFKILEYKPDHVTIRISQQRNAVGVYHDTKRLVEIVHETFDRFFPGRIIMVHPIPYKQSPANAVDAAWITSQMTKTGTRLKQIADDTGLDYPNLSTYMSGEKPIPQPIKAMFWFYFLAKKAEKATRRRPVS